MSLLEIFIITTLLKIGRFEIKHTLVKTGKDIYPTYIALAFPNGFSLNGVTLEYL